MRRLLSFTFLVAVLVVGCGGVSGPPEPRLIPGGGVGDGKIDGRLHVYVIDEDTNAVLSSASVRVGASSDPTPCTLLTDSTGLAKFERDACDALKGPATLTASAPGYAPATWIGVNATNITLGLRPTNPLAVETATVSGTIAGWANLPVPPANHQTLALIGYSGSDRLGDRANELMQGKRTLMVGTMAIPIDANLCVLSSGVSDCNWQLITRTGPQAHIAIIVDHFDNNTAIETDDTFTVTGYAIKTGLSFAANDTATGETLEMIPDVDMQTFTASFPSLPSGMNFMGGFPALELGEEGRIAFTTPALDMSRTTTRVPKLAGALADAHYSLIAVAQDAMDVPRPSTLAWVHGVNVASTVALPSWLPPPSNISVTNGTYAFSAVPGATLQGGEIQDANGSRVWSITVFDGSTSFTLPGLSSDPLPVGTLTFEATALQIPGVKVDNFTIEDVRSKIAGISNDFVTFTR